MSDKKKRDALAASLSARSDTLPRLNLDDARAVLGKMTPGPWHTDDPNTHVVMTEGGDVVLAVDSTEFRAYTGTEPFYDDANAEGIVYCVNNFSALVEEVAQLRAVLLSMKNSAGCWCCATECADHPHSNDCIEARAALSPAPDRVNERQQLEIVAKLVERWVLGDLSTEDYHAAVKEIFGVSRAGQE